MDYDKSNEQLKKLSQIIVEVLKDLAVKRKNLSTHSLFLSLSSRQEIKDLIALRHEPFKSFDGDRSSSSIEKLEAQKERLLKQLNELETNHSRARSFYERALLIFVDTIRVNENETFHESADQFKQLIKAGAEIRQLEGAFESFRTSIMREKFFHKPDRVDIIKQPTLFNRWLKSPKKDSDEAQFKVTYLPLFKEAFHNILNEFRLYIDENSNNIISEIEDRIQRAADLNDILSINQDVCKLIKDNISRLDAEREEAAALVKEIGVKLDEVKTQFLGSLNQARETHQANNDFNVQLEDRLKEFKGSVKFSRTLSELKRTIVSNLAIIDTAIKNKYQEDLLRMEDIDKKMGILRQNIDYMRNEILLAENRYKFLEQEILIDPLTGIYNRRAYERHMLEEIQRYLRHQHTFSMLLLDVDHFKQINDRCGHAVGDKCLKEIVNQVKPNLRESDFFARFGGEEFIVFLPETDLSGAMIVAEKLRKTVEKTDFIYKGKIEKITVSIGVTAIKISDQSPKTLFNRLDEALYDAKKTGRNRVMIR
ncbi:MAG: GGDEF domain-containing protein [Desulfobacterales bacterium]|nr:GGDEF domain-containing protein [Desulfobacterales bacterium]